MRAWGRVRARSAAADIPTAEFLRALDPRFSTVPAYLEHLISGKQQSFFLDSGSRQEFADAIRAVCPGGESLIISEADRACGHVFDLLGSGPVHLGDHINWHLDFRTGYGFDPRQYYADVRPAPYPGGYDIKVPWELSRCQHFVRLGQAYWITGDEKYPREFVAQVDDWIAENPWPWGVNWACTMDVAIRVVNWLWAYHFFRESFSLSNEFRLRFFKSLLKHGRHIWRNLEKQDMANNHYLADLAGLIYLGTLCPEFKEASAWRETGWREMWRELQTQVYEDGVSFEASIPYHRLAAELFLSPLLLGRMNRLTPPPEGLIRLQKMLDFIRTYSRPDGSVPMLGDADNGRLLRLAVWPEPEQEWRDHRHLLAVGAVVFDRADLARAAGDEWQDAVWLCGPDSIVLRGTSDPESLPGSRKFPEAQLYIFRNAGAHLLVESGRVGGGGLGAHNHHNPLGMELWLDGHVVLADPGTFVYTADWEAREAFRALRSHNTLEIEEPGAPAPGVTATAPPNLFRMDGSGRHVERAWESDAAGDFLCLERKEPEFLHIRRIRFDKAEMVFEFEDEVQSCRPWRYVLRLHLGAGLWPKVGAGGQVTFLSKSRQLVAQLCLLSPEWEIAVEPGKLSPSYGRNDPGEVLAFRSLVTSKAVLNYVLCRNLTGSKFGKAPADQCKR